MRVCVCVEGFFLPDRSVSRCGIKKGSCLINPVDPRLKIFFRSSEGACPSRGTHPFFSSGARAHISPAKNETKIVKREIESISVGIAPICGAFVPRAPAPRARPLHQIRQKRRIMRRMDRARAPRARADRRFLPCSLEFRRLAARGAIGAFCGFFCASGGVWLLRAAGSTPPPARTRVRACASAERNPNGFQLNENVFTVLS